MATATSFDDGLGESELAERFRSLWLDQRHALEEQGFNGESWRRAAHEVWWAQPKRLRAPDTEKKLAAALGISARTLRQWRHDQPERYQGGIEVAKRLVSEWLPDVMWAAIDNAINGGDKGASDRRLLAEVGGMKPQTGVDVTSGGAPLKAYSVLANPDLWDDDDSGAGALGAAAVADPAVAGQK
jgi:hypothetical protein